MTDSTKHLIDPRVFTDYAFFRQMDGDTHHPSLYRFARWVADCEVFGVDINLIPAGRFMQAMAKSGITVSVAELDMAGSILSYECKMSKMADDVNRIAADVGKLNGDSQ